MRLFIAVDLNQEIKDYIYEFERKLGNSDAKVNWVSKKNLHLTLKFLGEIPEDKINEIKVKLKNVKFKKFNLALDKFGFFPNEEFVRVVFIGIKPVENLNELQKIIDEETLELSSETVSFLGHLTLGRIRSIKNKKTFLTQIRNTEVANLWFEVSGFTLFKSTLTKDGPKYSALEYYSFR